MSLFDDFKDIHDQLYSNEIEMAAIWLEKAVLTEAGRRFRIAPDEKVRVEQGKLVDVLQDRPATHKVIGCMGTVSSSSLSFILQDLETQDFGTLKIK